MTAEGVIVVDGHAEGFFCADDNDPFFAAGDSGVEQVAVQELEMGGMNRHDNARTFAALVFVNGYGVR